MPKGMPTKKHRRIKKISGALVPYTKLDPGEAFFGLTDGRFSCAELLDWILQSTGPADVFISTWSVGLSEATWLGELLSNGRITDLQMVVDRSWPTRQEKFCRHLLRQVGRDRVRTFRSHAKIMVTRNADWAVTVRGSLNLNPNPRMEQFDLEDNPTLADWIIAEVFEAAFRDMDKMDPGAQQQALFFQSLYDDADRHADIEPPSGHSEPPQNDAAENSDDDPAERSLDDMLGDLNTDIQFE
jgi:hypothetical protein